METRQNLSSGALYRRFLAGGDAAIRPARLRGNWLDRKDLSPEALRAELDRVASLAGIRIIKSTHRSRIFRANMFGRDTLVKQYLLAGFGMRLKYLFRRSRGRRAWAAARTLQQLGLPTPEPFGFLEQRGPGQPHASFYFSAFLEDAKEARAWLRPRFHQQPPERRAAIRGEVLRLLLDLYNHRIYHADTKTRNLLLRAPEDDRTRTWFWIDLECLRFGSVPSRRHILRNLIQLNGSLGSKVPEEDRLAFLEDMARVYPWLEHPGIEHTIRRRTRVRLERELRREERP